MGYFVNVETDIKVYVEDVNPQGERTILLLHGWPANHNLFEYQINELAQLGYRCIAPDMRGFGNSDKPWRGYNYNRLADDVRCVVEALELNDFTLGGHSMGGAIAIRYMARHKGYGVCKLALFGAAAPSVTRRPNFPYGLPREDVAKLISETYNDRPKMLQGFGDMFFFQHVTEPFSSWFLHMGLEASGWSTAATAITFMEESLFKDLGEINVPTLILHGIHDKVCMFPLAEALKFGIKNSKLVPFEYSGHGLFWEERYKFNKELIRFME